MSISKGITILLLLTVSCISALYGNTVVRELYYRDYGLINRTVIVTSDKPQYTVERQNQNHTIVVTIERGSKSPQLDGKIDYQSKFLTDAILDTSLNSKAVLVIKAKSEVSVEPFFLSGKRNRIVLDIFSKQAPVTIEDKRSFLDFYTTVGYTSKAIDLINNIVANHPEYTGVNYYWGNLHLNNQRKNEAIEKYRKVGYNQREYLAAQLELMKLGVITYEYDDDIERAYLKYRDYFLQANDVRKQQFLSAWVSGLFSDSEEIKRQLLSMDHTNAEIEEMLANFSAVMQAISRDEQIKEKMPSLSKALTGPERTSKRGFLSLPVLLLIILALAFTVVLVYLLKKRLNRVDLLMQDSSIDFTITQGSGEASDDDREEPEVTQPLNHPINEDTDEDKPAKESEYQEETKTEVTLVVDEETEKSAEDPAIEVIEYQSLNAEQPKHEETEEETDYIKDEPGTQNNFRNLSSLKNEDLNRELACRLFNKGWAVATIAKELNTTEAEVEWYLSKS